MIKVIVALLLTLLSAAGVYGQEKTGIAVMETQGTADAAERMEVQLALTDGLRNSLNVKVFERSELSKVMKEHSLQVSDNFDESTAVEVGKLAGAKYICVSSVNTINGFEYRIVYRIIDVTTGETLASERIQADKNTFYGTIDKIASSKLLAAESGSANSKICGCELQEQDLPEGAAIPVGWRLPTLEELKCICANKKKVGGLNFGAYRSSTKQQGHIKGVKFQFCDEVFITGSFSTRLVRQTKEEQAAAAQEENQGGLLAGFSKQNMTTAELAQQKARELAAAQRKAKIDSASKAQWEKRKQSAAKKQAAKEAQAKAQQTERERARQQKQAAKEDDDEFERLYRESKAAPKTGSLVADGRKIYMNGKKLSKNEVQSLMANTDALRVYSKGLSRTRKGNIWLITGGSLFMFGAIVFIAEPFKTEYYEAKGDLVSDATLSYDIGGISMMMGIAASATGVIIRTIGRSNIRKSVDMYNHGGSFSSAELRFGATRNGVGFTLNF